MSENLESGATYYLRDGGPRNTVFYSVSRTPNYQPVVHQDYATGFVGDVLIVLSLALLCFVSMSGSWKSKTKE